MTRLFADTVFYLALLNRDDALHERTLKSIPKPGETIVTTAWVLTELADALSKRARREFLVRFLRDLRRSPDVLIVPPSQRLFDAGLKLFSERLDKDWSLTDCISFVVMQKHKLKDALTADHHFEQAGFNILLK